MGSALSARLVRVSPGTEASTIAVIRLTLANVEALK
jgi:hypothetical protein